MRCPECGRVASVPEWCARPICVHAWEGFGPEIWDGADRDGEGHPIEWSPNEEFRTPGPDTWTEMVPLALGHAYIEEHARAEALSVEVKRLREENEKLLALESGNWQAT